jgi:hypothetical protein
MTFACLFGTLHPIQNDGNAFFGEATLRSRTALWP